MRRRTVDVVDFLPVPLMNSPLSLGFPTVPVSGRSVSLRFFRGLIAGILPGIASRSSVPGPVRGCYPVLAHYLPPANACCCFFLNSLYSLAASLAEIPLMIPLNISSSPSSSAITLWAAITLSIRALRSSVNTL